MNDALSKYILLTLLLMRGLTAAAQGGNWVWVSGDSTANQPAFYTAIGTYDPLNKCSNRYEPCYWVDKTGCLWIYGGYQFDASALIKEDSSLWKYNPYINQWSLVKKFSLVPD